MSPPRSLTQLLRAHPGAVQFCAATGGCGPRSSAPPAPRRRRGTCSRDRGHRQPARAARSRRESLHELAEWAAAKGEDLSWVRVSAKCEQLGEHLTDRAARSDPIGVEALLRGRRGKPRQLLALLADAPGGSLPRSVLAAPLETGQCARVPHPAGPQRRRVGPPPPGRARGHGHPFRAGPGVGQAWQCRRTSPAHR